jgi:hypothetical protein
MVPTSRWLGPLQSPTKTKYLSHESRNVRKSNKCEWIIQGKESGTKVLPPLGPLYKGSMTTTQHSLMLRSNKLTVTVKRIKRQFKRL